MTIDAAVERLARFLQKQRYVEVYGHHDADGIAAASLVCHALWRQGCGFRLRIVERAPALDSEAGPTVLCDLGAGMEALPEQVAVLDHHAPAAVGDGPVLNPHLEGLNGEKVLSAAALAYLVANRLADCRDLAGIAAAGIVGDEQTFDDENAVILNDGIAGGVLELERGIVLAGESIAEQFELATDPYLPGISGDADRVRELFRASLGEDGPALDLLISLVVLDTAAQAAAGALEALWGNRVRCLREVIPDARTLSSVVDACGKSGRGGLAASVCLRSPGVVEEARTVAATFRRRVIGAIGSASSTDELPLIYLIEDPRLTSDVASALAGSSGGPVLVGAEADGSVRLSARGDGTVPLGPLLRQLAAETGGTGGGHGRRAGARIPSGAFPSFAGAFSEAVGG
jgi:single-stranded DNA-specific DHH superfamily exonuclease